ncbi:unnamed protein product, partial [Closterium sp. NIES-53]
VAAQDPNWDFFDSDDTSSDIRASGDDTSGGLSSNGSSDGCGPGERECIDNGAPGGKYCRGENEPCMQEEWMCAQRHNTYAVCDDLWSCNITYGSGFCCVDPHSDPDEQCGPGCQYSDQVRCTETNKCVRACDGEDECPLMKHPVTNQTLPYGEDENPEVCFTKENGNFKCQRQQKVIVPGYEEEGGVWIDVYLHISQVCDGKNDCPLGDDDEGATTGAAAAAALANTGTEASALSDDEDPAMCKSHNCSYGRWKCPGSTLCIEERQRCDGKNDCPVTASAADVAAQGMHGVTEGSDAAAPGVVRPGGSPFSASSSVTIGSPTLMPYTADEDPFLCRSFDCSFSWISTKQCPSTGRCLPLAQWCDGVQDCIDYSNYSNRSTGAANGVAYADDEDPEVCNRFLCLPYYEKCPNGVQCVEYSRFCNGVIDCHVSMDPASANKSATSAGGDGNSSRQWLHEEDFGFCESWSTNGCGWSSMHRCDNHPYCVNRDMGADMVKSQCTALDEWAKIQKDAAAAAAAKKADDSTAAVANAGTASGNSTSENGAAVMPSNNSTETVAAAAAAGAAGASGNSTSESSNPVMPLNTTSASRPGSSRRSGKWSEKRGDAGGADSGNKSEQGGGKEAVQGGKNGGEKGEGAGGEKTAGAASGEKQGGDASGVKRETEKERKAREWEERKQLAKGREREKKETAEKRKQEEEERKAREAEEKAKKEEAERARRGAEKGKGKDKGKGKGGSRKSPKPPPGKKACVRRPRKGLR